MSNSRTLQINNSSRGVIRYYSIICSTEKISLAERKRVKIDNRKEISEAIDFFQTNEIKVLENQSRKTNQKQPCFTGMIFAFEALGFIRETTEEILESIFVIYYAYTEIVKIDISTISALQIAVNQQSFVDFINLYNKEREHDDKMDISKLNFIKNKAVLNYAVQKLVSRFKSVNKIPNEILFPYFALLKAIEFEAEKHSKR